MTTNVPTTRPVPAMVPARPPQRASRRERIVAGLVACACLSVLSIAAWAVQPSPDGFGTHTQLGMPPCGWVAAFNKPCMTCCMTTSFAYMARGEFWSGFVTQPMGAFLAVVASGAMWAGLHGAIFGTRMGWLCGKIFTGRIMWPFLGLLLAAWAYKIVTWPK